MVKIENGKATRVELPDFLNGLAAESLLDLSWTDPALGVQGATWWPEENGDGDLGADKKWGAEVLTFDAERKVVIVTHKQVNLTAAEKAERDAAIVADWKQRIADRRYIAETSGTTINDMPIDTGRDSQGLITGAALQALIDPNYSLHWKTSAGFVDLTGQQVLGVASAVRAFVQACFNRESDLLDAVAAGTITAEMLEEGWPRQAAT